MEDPNFGLVNYAVLLSMLLISMSIGIYFRFSGGRQKTIAEFLYASREMTALPLAFSLMSSFISAITLLGVSAEIYSYGTMYVIHNIAYGVCTPIVTQLFMPVYFNVGVNSVYEYLEKRFGTTAKLAGSFAFTIQMVLYMGVALYAPALALEVVTGMPKSYAILLVGLVCTFYSTVGGLKAVIFTDVFQSLLMYAAVFSVVIVAWIDKGSLLEIWHVADAHGRIELANFDLDPTVRHTWWGIFLGGSITYLSVYAVNQGQIQRYISTGNLKTAQKAVWMNWPVLSMISLSTSFAGLSIFSRYARCDPLKTCQISRSDQLMPYYVMDTMQHLPGLPGLFVSGIFSAALSTVSAAMNSLAAVTLEDYIKPVYKRLKNKDFPDGNSLCVKIISIVYGLICVAFAFMADELGGVLQAALTILGVVGGPTLGLFSLGMIFPFVNEFGAVTGFASSLAFTFLLGFSNKPNPKKLPVFSDGCLQEKLWNCTVDLKEQMEFENLEKEYFYLFRFSYVWLSLFGFLICVVIGIVLSLVVKLLTKQSSNNNDPDMFIPPISCFLKRHCGMHKVSEQFIREQAGKINLKGIVHGEEEMKPCLKLTGEL